MVNSHQRPHTKDLTEEAMQRIKRAEEQKWWPGHATESPLPKPSQQHHSLLCKNTNLSVKLCIIEDLVNFLFPLSC